MADKKNKPTQVSNEMGEVKTSSPSKDRTRARNIIFAVLGILLILCLCLSAYLIDLYRRNNPQPSGQNDQTQNNNSGNTQNNNGEGNGNGNPAPAPTPAGTVNPEPAPQQTPAPTTPPASNAATSSTETTNTGHSQVGLARALANISEIDRTGIWRATQYQQGDIVSHTYVVHKGDTLWQIAKAYYGSGFEWKRILNANSSKIGFLPNGEQALIFPNQVLNIP